MPDLWNDVKNLEVGNDVFVSGRNGMAFGIVSAVDPEKKTLTVSSVHGAKVIEFDDAPAPIPAPAPEPAAAPVAEPPADKEG